MNFESDPNLHSVDRLADLSREAVHWPDSEYNDLGNEFVYHSTNADSALDIVGDEGYNPMQDDLLDGLRIYALRDVEAVEEGSIDLGEYLVENEQELLDHGPEAVREVLGKKDVEELANIFSSYGFDDMDVRRPTIGARRTNSLHVGSDREHTRTQSNFGSDVTFELLVPENSRHDSDIPGEIPFSYTTAVYVNDDADDPEQLFEEIEQQLGEKYSHIKLEKNF